MEEFGSTQMQSEITSRAYCLLNLLFLLSFSGFEFVINFYLSEEFSFTPKNIGLTFLYIGSIIILVQGGIVRRLSGKISERSMALYGAYSVAIGFMVLLFGRDIFTVFISLFFLAFGSALVNPGLSSFASLESEEKDQGMTLGLFRSFGSLARAISPIVFSILYFQKGPQFTFILSLLVLFVFLILLHQTKSKFKTL